MSAKSSQDQRDRPDLIEILKVLGGHREKVRQEVYGPLEQATELERFWWDFREALGEADYQRADRALRGFLVRAGCSPSGREWREIRKRLHQAIRRHKKARGCPSLEPRTAVADLGPAVKKACDHYLSLAEGEPTDKSPYWRHPVRSVARWIHERTGIEEVVIEDAARRLNTPLGLSGMEPLPTPDGTQDDTGAPDYSWVPDRLRELDREGPLDRLYADLWARWPDEMCKAGRVPQQDQAESKRAVLDDPITLEQVALLLLVEPKTIQNRGTKGRPKPEIGGGRGQRAVWRYRALHPWLLAQFPEYKDRLPEDYEEAKRLFSNT